MRPSTKLVGTRLNVAHSPEFAELNLADKADTRVHNATRRFPRIARLPFAVRRQSGASVCVCVQNGHRSTGPQAPTG